MFDAEAALKNVKLAMLERLDLQIFFTPAQPWGEVDLEIFLRKIFRYFTKSKMASL